MKGALPKVIDKDDRERVQTRMVSLLGGQAEREDAGHAQGRGRRPAPLRGDRHPAHARLPRAGDRIAEARRRAARRALRRRPHDVRAHHARWPPTSRCTSSWGARTRWPGSRRWTRARWWPAPRCACPTATARKWPRAPPMRSGLRAARPASRPNAPSCCHGEDDYSGDAYFVSARAKDEQGRRRPRLHLERLAARHRALALQRADQHASRSPTASPTRCSTARCCAPARRCR